MENPLASSVLIPAADESSAEEVTCVVEGGAVVTEEVPPHEDLGPAQEPASIKFGIQSDGSYLTNYAVTIIHKGGLEWETFAEICQRVQVVVCGEQPVAVSNVTEFLTPLVLVACEVKDSDEDFLSRGFTKVVRGGLAEFLPEVRLSGADVFVLEHVFAARQPGYQPAYEIAEEAGPDFVRGVERSESFETSGLSLPEYIAGVARSVTFLARVEDFVSAGRTWRMMMDQIAADRLRRAVSVGDLGLVQRFVCGGDVTDRILHKDPDVIVWAYAGMSDYKHMWNIIKGGVLLTLSTEDAREILPMLQ